jgi:hypothetical protein
VIGGEAGLTGRAKSRCGLIQVVSFPISTVENRYRSYTRSMVKRRPVTPPSLPKNDDTKQSSAADTA